MDDKDAKKGPSGPARSDEGGSGSDAKRPASMISTLHRGVQILEMIISADKPIRLTEIASHFDMDRASAYRFLQTLEYDGLVTKDKVHKTYMVGGRLLQWSSKTSGEFGVIKMARPFLERLNRLSGESVHFGVLHNKEALLVDYIGSKGTVVVHNRVGVHEPLHCTAIGKALLAYQPGPVRDAMIRKIPLKRFTENTIGEKEELLEVLGSVKESGVAHDDGEYDPVLYCIACPVIQQSGLPLGAIGVSVVRPLILQDSDQVRQLVEKVRAVALEFTTHLCGRDMAESIFGKA